MYKKLYHIATLCLALMLGTTTLTAQTMPVSQSVVTSAMSEAKPRYAYISYSAVMRQMPEYAEAQASIARVRTQYEAETKRNETSFSSMFADFLAGQKDFPQSILLKRQKELQEAMDKGIAFRAEAQKMVVDAEVRIMRVVHDKLDSAIHAVAAERGYEYVANTDEKACLYLNPALSEDAAPMVLRKLGIAAAAPVAE